MIALLGRVFRAITNSGGDPASGGGGGTPGSDNPALWSSGVMGRNNSGVQVNQQTALTYSALWRAINLIAGTVACLDIIAYERQEGDPQKKVIVNLPGVDLFTFGTSEEVDAFAFRWSIIAHGLTWGNGYAEIERTFAGDPVALHLLDPSRVTPFRDALGRLMYRILNVDGSEDFLEPPDIFHFKGLAYDGLRGYSPIELFRNAIGLALATERYGSAFFGNGAAPGGVIESDKVIEDQSTIDRMKEQWNAIYRGPDKAHQIAVLQDGAKWKAITFPNDVAQFLETRKFQIGDIARIYGVPPHMLGEMDRATFSNIEHQAIEWVTGCLMFWATAWEKETDRRLTPDRRRYYTRHDLTSLLRGDAVARATYYKTMTGIGAFSINDVLIAEGRNPIGPLGDMRFVPINVVPLDKAAAVADALIKKAESGGSLPSPDNPNDPNNPNKNAAADADASTGLGRAVAAIGAVLPSFVAEMERANRKAGKAVERMAGRPGVSAESFAAEVEAFYTLHEQTVAAAFGPHVRTASLVCGLENVQDAEAHARAVLLRELAAQRAEFVQAFRDDPRAVSLAIESIEGRADDVGREMLEAIGDTVAAGV